MKQVLEANILHANTLGNTDSSAIRVTYKRYLGSDSKYYVTSDGKTYCVRN